MRPVVVVVDEILEQFVGEVVEIVEGGAIDNVVVEGPPQALDLAVGLWAIRPGIAVFDAKLEQHSLEGMLAWLVAGCELGPVVGQDFLEDKAVGGVLNITGSAFLEVSTSAQARREQLSIRLMT